MRREVIAEGLGSMLLAAAVIGSGIMAQRLTDDGAVALLPNTRATAAALAVLIAVLAPISKAHFNPAVSLVSCLQGQLSPAMAASYMVAQLIGFHVLCKPCHHARAIAEQYVFGNRTGGCPELHRRSTRGQSDRNAR